MARKKRAQKSTVCPVCYWKPSWSTRKRRMERHHLLPIASGGGGLGQKNLVRICSYCHLTAHKKWGPGDRYTGPIRKREFVLRLRDILSENRFNFAS